jgi:Tfp pilus assembly protein PilF
MHALLLSAGIDHGHGRIDEALAKYTHVLGYYQHTANPTMQTVAMHGTGMALQQVGRMEEAVGWFERATVTASESGAPVVMALVLRSLGEVMVHQGRFAEGEHYFRGLGTVAAHGLDLDTSAFALERAGWCALQRSDYATAAKTWETAATYCREHTLSHRLQEVLGRLIDLYRSARQTDRIALIERELRGLELPS